MKPAWDQLAGEYDGHASVTVGDVDCTVSRAQRHSLQARRAAELSAGALAWGQVERDLCQNEGVRGYPTIKYWKGGAESKYQVSARPSSHPLPAPVPLLLMVRLAAALLPNAEVVCAMRRQGGRDFAALKKFVESTLL